MCYFLLSGLLATFDGWNTFAFLVTMKICLCCENILDTGWVTHCGCHQFGDYKCTEDPDPVPRSQSDDLIVTMMMMMMMTILTSMLIMKTIMMTMMEMTDGGHLHLCTSGRAKTATPTLPPTPSPPLLLSFLPIHS